MKGVVFFVLVLIKIVTSDDLQEFINGNNKFTADVYKALSVSTQDNFAISPISVEIILALTQSGAKGRTAQEIRDVLRLSNLGRTENTFRALLDEFRNGELYTLKTANRIYIKDGVQLKKSFRVKARQVYDTDAENIDFSDAQNAANTINSFVSEQTNGRIRDLVEASKLDDQVQMMLINTLYFKANWSEVFNNFISQEDFYMGNGYVKSNVSTMHKTGGHLYYESSALNAKFLQLPFRNRDASMVVVLPNDKDGLARIENQIERVLNTKTFEEDLVKIKLPKFRIETKALFNDVLTRLGMHTAFTPYADFSGIAGEPGTIAISDVLQKTFVDVNQNGVEATSATSVGYVLLSGSAFTGEPKEFFANHPFLFYIQVKDIVLFVGRVTNP